MYIEGVWWKEIEKGFGVERGYCVERGYGVERGGLV